MISISKSSAGRLFAKIAYVGIKSHRSALNLISVANFVTISLLFILALPCMADPSCTELLTPTNSLKTHKLSGEQEALLIKSDLAPHDYKFLGQGAEGSVFFNSKSQNIIKIFEYSDGLDLFKAQSEYYEESLKAAGFIIPKMRILSEEHNILLREYISGPTLSDYYKKLNKKEKTKLAKKLKTLNARFLEIFLKNSPDGFENMTYTYQDELEALHGEFFLNDLVEGIAIHLHDENLVVTHDSSGEPQFVVIDFQ